ncbi:MAG: FAD-binding oxidoreductase [Patescibacteria group bacterium]
MNLKDEIKKIIEGEILDDNETLKKYSRDASLFEVWPELVVYPKVAKDIANIVKFVAQKKEEDPEKYKNLSITVRAAGSCMSGGSLSESIILDVTKYLNKFSINKEKHLAEVEPGVFYRDFEPATLEHNLILPCYTASKNLCALGGMIGNNAAGEKTLNYGKMENFVEELEVVLSDGSMVNIKALARPEALRKSHEHSLEGAIYERMMRLLDNNREDILKAKPTVSKNSAGYYLWNIEYKGLFDLAKIIVGSQGTLGIVTKAKLRLVETKLKSKLLIIFMKDIEKLGEVVNTILEFKPESVESYDDSTMKLAVRFLPEMFSLMKSKLLKIMWGFLPEAWMVATGGMPKLILMAEFAGKEENEIKNKIKTLNEKITKMGFKTRVTKDESDAEKYWTIRHESFNLLRKHIRGKRTAPFIDDICIEPKYLPEFLPKLRKILDEAKLLYTIAGHAGNGNFHIIPLMNMRESRNRSLVPYLSDKVYDLLKKYNGSITAEHNDGLVRTPYLNKMYSDKILELFRETKHIFDPHNIFNPGKKVPSQAASGPGTVEYLVGHLAKT